MRRRSLALSFVWLVIASAASASDPAPTLEAVLAKLSAIEALSARYREEKHMALLAEPLMSEGTLHYAKPRQLVKRTEKPKKAGLLLRDDTVSFGTEAASQKVSLSSHPALRVLVDTFVSVLAGDHQALIKVAEVSLVPRDGGYRIVVVPKDAKVRRLVREMAFEGTDVALSRMEIRDASGDLTVTSFRDVTVRKPFSDAERARLFRLGN